MKTTFSLKFKRPIIFSIILTIILGFSCLNAQIVYTDIEPDFISPSSGNNYILDLNNDGTADFSIGEFFEMLYFSANSNGVNAIYSIAPWYVNVLRLDYGAVIFDPPNPSTNGQYYNDSSIFNIGECFGGGGNCNYNWENQSDRYAGLRFQINGQTHYGWVRMDVTSLNHWVVKDYAYQSTPNTLIRAGYTTSLGFNDSNDFENIVVTTSNKTISIYNLNEVTDYKLFSINGQLMFKGNISKENNSIDASMFSSGIYIIELLNSNTGQIVKKKLII